MPETERKEVRVETRMSAIELGIKEIKEQLDRISKKLSKAESKEKEQTERIIKIENICLEYNEMRKEINEIKIQNIDLKKKITKLEENARWEEKKKNKKMLEIYGIPRKNGENPKDIVIRLGRSAKVAITENDLEESYRVQSKDGNGKQVVAKFRQYEKKAEFLKAMKEKRPRLSDINENPENKLIYVNEKLTAENKRILYVIKEEAKQRKWHKVWVYAGEVYLMQEDKGRNIKIENLEQMEVLIKQ